MKIPQQFTIYDLRFTIAGKSRGQFSNRQSATRLGEASGAAWVGNRQCLPERARPRALQYGQPGEHESIQGFRLARCPVLNRQSSIVNRQSERGIALVITLIMLAITLVMAVAFLALAHRERASVTGQTDITTARLASDTAQAAAEGQIMANISSSLVTNFNGLGSSNAYNLSLLVSTNYINPLGFNAAAGVNGSPNPTNVNYNYTVAGAVLNANQRNQNISNLWFLPRVPVCVPTNQPVSGYDFRYYLDLNQNGRPETNYYGPDFDNLGNPMAGPPSLHTGDPEWIGVLEHPDAPHGPNNHFIARYAFIAVPVGNTLDVNYIHNQAQNAASQVPNTSLDVKDGYMRNQGVGAWEMNLAAFLADLNTNIWSPVPLPANLYYAYNEPGGYNSGYAFQDALSLLSYRYNSRSLPAAYWFLTNAPSVFPYDGLDAYSDGPLQTTLDTNADANATAGVDGDWQSKKKSWSGADNPNHYFTPSDFFDAAKLGSGANTFPGRLSRAGSSNDTYNAYTYYRMLNQLGTDSAAEAGKLNLNYSNAVVNYIGVNGLSGVSVPTGVGIVPGAETNLAKWMPQDFFIAAADRMLRAYSTEWFQNNPTNYLITYYGAFPRGYLDATGLGVTNFPDYGITNQIPSFGVTNIPVYINGNFVYSPAVNRLLQLAANLYDATTNSPYIGGIYLNLPHVFRPIFEHDNVGNIFIVGYTNLNSKNGPNTVSIPDPQLDQPVDISLLTNLTFAPDPYKPILNPAGTSLVNVYGVPWIIGAKKGLPNFNQFYMLNGAQVTRKLEVTRSSLDPQTASYATNQMYVFSIGGNLGASFWNSYSSSYPPLSRPVTPMTIYASDIVSVTLTNQLSRWHSNYVFSSTITENSWPNSRWPGSQWTGLVPNAVPNSASFVTNNWAFTFLSPVAYDFATAQFDSSGDWQPTTPPLPQLPQFGLLITNYLQAYILDGNNVIDYVQLRDPISIGGLNQGLSDRDYPQPDNIYYQWSTNTYGAVMPYGVFNQLWISGHPSPSVTPAGLMPPGGQWSTASTPMGDTTPPAEAAFFNGFFVPNFQYNGQSYVNNQLSIQAPYTPSRTVYSSFLLQANDPLVHYTSSDLNSQAGTTAVWQNQSYLNAIWYHSDDPSSQPLPQAPQLPIKGRYQPWGASKQMAVIPGVDQSGYNLAFKDPMAWGSDYWDFPTNQYPSVGWIGRVHRGTPWQTVYLKSTNVLADAQSVGNQGVQNVGFKTWAQWSGDIQTVFNQYYDSLNSAPQQDFLLFDLFTTQFNDNATRGTLPVNVGAGQPDGGLAAWSALFSGMVALTNNAPAVFANTRQTNSYLVINPAGTINPALGYQLQPPLWQIVNGPLGINATRTNKILFPLQAFNHVGDILATPALSTFSPFLNAGSLTAFGQQQWEYGINDEMYEWLPQQMMGLVRSTQPRYLVYCFGQALRPAPNGTVLSGPFSLLVTNYQVVAESAVRAVIRVDNANTAAPHPVVETSNVLPPN